jgi:hypothetical protein
MVIAGNHQDDQTRHFTFYFVMCQGTRVIKPVIPIIQDMQFVCLNWFVTE